MSSPVHTKGFWIDPCGGDAVPDAGAGERRSDADILESIMVPATRALSMAETVADAYGRETFSKSVHDLDKDFPDRVFPKEKNPKKYGEDTPSEHYKELMEKGLGRNLLRHYSHLQDLAIELNGVVQDQKNYGGAYYQRFKELRPILRQVLCEALSGINDLGLGDEVVVKTGPVDRVQLVDETFRVVRDFRVLREYILYMEYLLQGLQFFKANLQ